MRLPHLSVFLLAITTLQQEEQTSAIPSAAPSAAPSDAPPFLSSVYPGADSPDPAALAAENAVFSPPYYPSPWGTGSGNWSIAYSRARAFAQQLTLAEKINLTTGIG